MRELAEHEKILLQHTRSCLHCEIPKSFTELSDMLWRAFKLGEQYQLTSPSGLIAKKECNHILTSGAIVGKLICPYCHGTGFTTRKLTIQEAVEWAKMIILSIDPNGPLNKLLELPNNERIEGEKE